VKNQKIIVAYVPVLHRGYYQLFSTNKVNAIYIFGPEIIKKFDYLRKEIRALEPKFVKSAIEGWKIGTPIIILTATKLKKLAQVKNLQIISPNEDVTRELLAQYLPKSKVEWSPIFLRWDRDSAIVNQPIKADKKLSAKNQKHQKLIAHAFAIAEESSDWWRHVGAVLADKNGVVIAASANRHQPSDHTPYALGDARSLFKRGKYVEVGTAIHAEGALIAQAAKQGISLKGAKLFLTDFPCPYCARIVANSGITELYFANGYAMLDGKEVLKKAGIKLIQIEGIISDEGINPVATEKSSLLIAYDQPK